ncbi:hypothetical protein QAD02_023279 [Eretmocerus hayati]|uniref:Uncharacterized protein n=1 Tax=Eretmocerus hayati TaxID=131215 RepID=A0ACC2PVM8_9HYME|nr:hypothetical protein QAD02_023279 [Eretmocerus hayati]
MLEKIFLPILLICQFFVSSKTEPLWGAYGSEITKVQPSKQPFVVLITNKDSINDDEVHLCTGSLISHEHVLTGAYCLKNLPESNLQVHVQSTSPKSKKTIPYGVSFKITYEQWCKFRNDCTFVSYTDDISILKLSDSVNQVGLGKISYEDNLRDTVRMFGWGHLADYNRPKVPRKGVMKILKKQECEERVKSLVSDGFNQVELPSKLFCAVANPPIFGVQGDFGGPVLNSKGQILAIFVRRCPALFCGDILPGQVNLILRLTEFKDFITDATTRY